MPASQRHFHNSTFFLMFGVFFGRFYEVAKRLGVSSDLQFFLVFFLFFLFVGNDTNPTPGLCSYL